jgi:hypothetical protein
MTERPLFMPVPVQERRGSWLSGHHVFFRICCPVGESRFCHAPKRQSPNLMCGFGGEPSCRFLSIRASLEPSIASSGSSLLRPLLPSIQTRSHSSFLISSSFLLHRIRAHSPYLCHASIVPLAPWITLPRSVPGLMPQRKRIARLGSMRRKRQHSLRACASVGSPASTMLVRLGFSARLIRCCPPVLPAPDRPVPEGDCR